MICVTHVPAQICVPCSCYGWISALAKPGFRWYRWKLKWDTKIKFWICVVLYVKWNRLHVVHSCPCLLCFLMRYSCIHLCVPRVLLGVHVCLKLLIYYYVQLLGFQKNWESTYKITMSNYWLTPCIYTLLKNKSLDYMIASTWISLSKELRYFCHFDFSVYNKPFCCCILLGIVRFLFTDS